MLKTVVLLEVPMFLALSMNMLALLFPTLTAALKSALWVHLRISMTSIHSWGKPYSSCIFVPSTSVY